MATKFLWNLSGATWIRQTLKVHPVPSLRAISGMEPETLIVNEGFGWCGLRVAQSEELLIQSSRILMSRSVTIERSSTPSAASAIKCPSHPCRNPKDDVNPRDRAGKDPLEAASRGSGGCGSGGATRI